MKGDKLAKYIRCMFHAVLPLDAALGQRLMRQAVQVARDSHKVRRSLIFIFILVLFYVPLFPNIAPPKRRGFDAPAPQGQHPFPPEELEWLVTVSFNQAVDAYNARRDDECNTWADLATNLAHYADDGGGLEKRVQESRMKLRFELP